MVLGGELEDEPVALGRRHGLGREREVGLRYNRVVGGLDRGNGDSRCEKSADGNHGRQLNVWY